MPKQMTFMDIERGRAEVWKRNHPELPDAAREPAQYVDKDGQSRGTAYPFCLPRQYAKLSLLPEVRHPALALFAELGIPWHAGIDGGPSNHLLSSQVQCVNALAQMIGEPDRVVRAFGPRLGTSEVREIEPGRFLTFEYIGGTDYFNEAPGGRRVRGAHCTSVDAAFVHQTTDGLTELVLVEWKYTESYRRRGPEPTKDATRWGRYGAARSDPNGPVRSDLLPFEELCDEPLYQLVRQQLLAHALEASRAHGADRVRVAHVTPAANVAYQHSLHRPSQQHVGTTVAEVWQRLLRHSDRFLSMDSATFLDPEITSPAYVARYGDGVPSKDFRS
jgi:hypothetical protein